MTDFGQLGPAAYENLTVEELKEQLVILDDLIAASKNQLQNYQHRRLLCILVMNTQFNGGVRPGN